LDLEEEQRTLDQIAVDFWMATDDFFEHTDLKVWSDSGTTYLFISAPFERRPLGRLLPPVETAGCCTPSPDKQWVVSHNAVRTGECRRAHRLHKLRVSVRCSKCGHTLPIQTNALEGWLHYYNHKYAVQVPCQT
jgi:hypothetical protein